MKRILVTGAGGPAAYNFVQSLRQSKEKFYIVGTDTNIYHLELTDLDASYVLPEVSDSEYLSKLNQVITKEKIQFVHPQPDPEVYFLSENRENINARLFLPDKKVIKICQDKMQLAKVLSRNMVPVAKSYSFRNEKEFSKKFKSLLRYTDKIWVRAIHGAGSRASLPVKTVRQAKAWIEYWESMKGIGFAGFMICEFLPGKEFAFQSLWKDGKLITSQARERIEYVFGNLTPSGQTSSPAVAKTVHRKDVNEIATKAIITIDKKVSGVFCVDLKENKDGIPCVTEINAGRFFTTSNFYPSVGFNMPYFYVKLAFGEKIPQLKKYDSLEENIYWIRMIDMGNKAVKGNIWKSRMI